MSATKPRRPITRYRLNAVGDVIPDTRRFSPEFLDPDGNKYRKGSPLLAPKPSSPARLTFRAASKARRAAVKAKTA